MADVAGKLEKQRTSTEQKLANIRRDERRLRNPLWPTWRRAKSTLERLKGEATAAGKLEIISVIEAAQKTIEAAVDPEPSS